MTNSRKDASDLLAQMSKRVEGKDGEKAGATEKAKEEAKAKSIVADSKPRKSGGKAGAKGTTKATTKGSGKAGSAKKTEVDPLAKQPKEQLNTTVDPLVKDAIMLIQMDVKKSGAKKPKMGEVIEQAVFDLLKARGLAVD